jgi:hypothetical protein
MTMKKGIKKALEEVEKMVKEGMVQIAIHRLNKDDYLVYEDEERWDREPGESRTCSQSHTWEYNRDACLLCGKSREELLGGK